MLFLGKGLVFHYLLHYVVELWTPNHISLICNKSVCFSLFYPQGTLPEIDVHVHYNNCVGKSVTDLKFVVQRLTHLFQQGVIGEELNEKVRWNEHFGEQTLQSFPILLDALRLARTLHTGACRTMTPQVNLNRPMDPTRKFFRKGTMG